jgi:hypothetical protein
MSNHFQNRSKDSCLRKCICSIPSTKNQKDSKVAKTISEGTTGVVEKEVTDKTGIKETGGIEDHDLSNEGEGTREKSKEGLDRLQEILPFRESL